MDAGRVEGGAMIRYRIIRVVYGNALNQQVDILYRPECFYGVWTFGIWYSYGQYFRQEQDARHYLLRKHGYLPPTSYEHTSAEW